MAWKLGTLQRGLVLDLPLIQKYHNVGADTFTDRTPSGNSGANNGADVDVDHSTFVAANSDHVRIADSPSLSPINAMTAMAWVKGAAQVTKGILTHYDAGANQRGFSLLSGGSLSTVVVSDNGQYTDHIKYYTSSIITMDDTWHLIGFTFNAGTLKLYVDGVEDINSTKIFDATITTIHDSTVDITVGCYLTHGAPVAFFNGDLARARMWNRALTNAEWALTFDQEKGLYL